MHLVGFIVRIYHDARSPERQIHKITVLRYWHYITVQRCRYKFVAVYTYCVYKHLCDPVGSCPDGACEMWSVGSCTRTTAVELAERQVQLKNSRSRSSATGDHYAEISGGDSCWLEIDKAVGQRLCAFGEVNWAWVVMNIQSVPRSKHTATITKTSHCCIGK